MRLDVFLKLSRLIPRRTLAKELTKGGLIKVNGATAKASRNIQLEDQIDIRKRDRVTKVKVRKIPEKKKVSKKESCTLYEIIEDYLQRVS